MTVRATTLAVAAATALALSACGTASDGDAGSSAAGPSTSAASDASQGVASEAADGSGDEDAGGSDGGSDATSPGSYLTLAEYEADPAAHAGTAVVYFFHADWCPSCRATEASVAEAGVPDGLTLVKVDFDTATDLRQEYGVTTQHTFVQVDGSGKALGTWTGSGTGEEILAETV